MSGGTAVTEPYRLAPSDDVSVRFRYFNDLNDEAVIGPDGTVVLQDIGGVKLAGLTLDQATDELNTRYGKVIREPTVTLSVKTYALQQIYVAGEVNNPGVVRDTVPLTLSRAIAQAGGLKLGTAKSSAVILVRRTPDGTVRYYQVDMSNGVIGTAGDPVLISYDLVYVPETPVSQVAEFVSENLVRMVPYNITTQFNP